MRDDILLHILFDLFTERKITAAALAEKYSLSPRTVYRYVKRLAAFLPLEITQGRAGGITLPEQYLLPTDFFTREEHAAALEALTLAYAQTAQPRFLEAKRKLNGR